MFFFLSQSHELKGCVTHVNFLQNGRRHTISELTSGNFSLKIRANTLAGKGPWTAPIYVVVSDPPSVPSWVVIILCVAIPIAVLLIAAVVGRYLHKRNLKKKMPEYIINMISTCPDYISTLDVYKPDEWELPRKVLHKSGSHVGILAALSHVSCLPA